MLVRLVRHACALDRIDWQGDDADRPLDPTGVEQSLALADLLRGEPPGALVSSSALRCVATLGPLAAEREDPVAVDPALGVGAGVDDVLAILGRAAEGDVLCTHGEVMERLLEVLDRPDGEDTEALLAKGTVWELDVVGGAVVGLRHVDPTADPAGRTGRIVGR